MSLMEELQPTSLPSWCCPHRRERWHAFQHEEEEQGGGSLATKQQGIATQGDLALLLASVSMLGLCLSQAHILVHSGPGSAALHAYCTSCYPGGGGESHAGRAELQTAKGHATL